MGTEGAPLVLPLDYAVNDSDVLIQVGESLFTRIDGRMVAFQVDSGGRRSGDPASEGRWSVLVRGLASELEDSSHERFLPRPRVAEPGHRLVHLRGDVVTGRRLRPPEGG